MSWVMDNAPHPGVILKESLQDELGLSVSKSANQLGVSRVALSRVLNGRAAISPSLALRLEAAGLSTARQWLALQTAYDLARTRKELGELQIEKFHEVA